MTTPQLREIERIFHVALECEPGKVNAFLDTACGGDASLRERVDALLSSDRQATDFIEKPPTAFAARVIEAQARETDSVIGRTIGHYKIRQHLGSGGMGEVYVALDTRSERKAVLKLLPARFTSDPERIKRFRHEARALVALNHPNILTTYEIGEEDSTYYIVSELVEGETLRQRLDRHRLELKDAIDVTIQVASALASAHEAGIVHRDIKPENIMLRRDGYVKVLDFGIAKLAEQELPSKLEPEEALSLVATHVGSILGTVRYMSPEQARGEPVDHRTDIWSLGVMLYEMVTGLPPFSGVTPQEIISAALTSEPTPIARQGTKVPFELQEIISRALQKDREKRYGGMHEMLEALRILHRKLEFSAELEHAPFWLRWIREPVALLLILLVTILAVTLPLFWNRSKSQEIETKPSIAVLPFVNMSTDKENEYLGDGITEDLCTALSQIKGLRVPARTSSFMFKGKTEDIRKIGKQLNVSTVLEGSVSRAGNKVRISVQLNNVADGYHMWAETYDRYMTDILEIRSEISRKVADALKVQLGVKEMQLLAKKPTENSEAYEIYLLGRFEFNKFTEDGFTNSLAHFQQAIALDPKFALAYASLADAYNTMGYWGYLSPKEAFPKAKRAAQMALNIDPDLAEAHGALGYVEFQYEWKFKEAESEFKEAIRLNPNSVSALLRFLEYLFDFQRTQEAQEQLERARELDPLSIQIAYDYAAVSWFERDFDRAIEQLQKTISMDPNNALAYQLLSAVFYQKKMPAQAFTAHERFNSLEGIFSDAEMAEMRKVYETAGLSAYFQKENELRQKRLAQGKYQSPLNIALNYAFAGADSEALDWLERAVDEHTPWLPELKIDPMWDAVRSHPRFVALLKKVGLEKSSEKPEPDQSIAVLPFENLSTDKDNGFFAEGIQDEILTRLSKIADLKVISRTSTQKYKSAPANLRDVAQQLGVSNILEGSVQRMADQVRISVQLINALNDSHLWAETYDRKLIDSFQVESDIAEKIASTLEAKLSGKEKAAINARGTDNAQAYETYLRAVALNNSQSDADNARMRDLLREAVRLDPNFAEAWAWLAVIESNRYFFPEESPAQKERARNAAETALRLAPDSADAIGSMGLYYYYVEKNYDEALRLLDRAREIAPNVWRYISATAPVKRRQGKLDETIALQERGAELDPLNVSIWMDLAWSYRGRRDFEHERAILDRALTISPNDANIVAQKAESYAAAGDLEKSWQMVRDLKFEPSDNGAGIALDIVIARRDYDEAIRRITAMRESGKEPPLFQALDRAVVGQLKFAQGDSVAAEPLLKQAEGELTRLRDRQEGGIIVLDQLIFVEACLGRPEEVERIGEQLRATRFDKWTYPFNDLKIATAYALMGDADRAVPLLDTVLHETYAWAATPAYLRFDPRFYRIRNDPRFQKLANGPP
jgi:eukaryotic-like serine/threonine-protein kinase